MSGRSVCALGVTLAVLAGSAGCGGAGSASVAWKGHPRSGPVEGGRMLFGTVVNRSARLLQLRAADVRVLDRSGRELPAAAAFSGGYNPGIALRGFGAEMFAAATPSAGDGANVDLAPRATVPLSVSWNGAAVVVEVAGARLTLH
jgi:hypothetical protein